MRDKPANNALSLQHQTQPNSSTGQFIQGSVRPKSKIDGSGMHSISSNQQSKSIVPSQQPQTWNISLQGTSLHDQSEQTNKSHLNSQQTQQQLSPQKRQNHRTQQPRMDNQRQLIGAATQNETDSGNKQRQMYPIFVYDNNSNAQPQQMTQGTPQLLLLDSAQLQKDGVQNSSTESAQKQMRRFHVNVLTSGKERRTAVANSSQQRTIDGLVGPPSAQNEYIHNNQLQTSVVPFYQGSGNLQNKVFSFANQHIAHNSNAASGNFMFVPSIAGGVANSGARINENGMTNNIQDWAAIGHQSNDSANEVTSVSQLTRHSSKKKGQLSIGGGPTSAVNNFEHNSINVRGHSQRSVAGHNFSNSFMQKSDGRSINTANSKATNGSILANAMLVGTESQHPRVPQSILSENQVGSSASCYNKQQPHDLDQLLTQMKNGNPQRHIFQFQNGDNLPHGQQVQVVVGSSQPQTQNHQRPDSVKWKTNAKVMGSAEGRRIENYSGAYPINQRLSNQANANSNDVRDGAAVHRGRSHAPTPTAELNQGILVQRTMGFVGGGFKPISTGSNSQATGSKVSLAARTNLGGQNTFAVFNNMQSSAMPGSAVSAAGSSMTGISSASLAGKYIKQSKALQHDNSQKRLVSNQSQQAASLDRARQQTTGGRGVVGASTSQQANLLSSVTPIIRNPHQTPIFAQQNDILNQQDYCQGVVGIALRSSTNGEKIMNPQHPVAPAKQSARNNETKTQQSPTISHGKNENLNTRSDRKSSLQNSPAITGPLVRSGAASVNQTSNGISEKWKARSIANYVTLNEPASAVEQNQKVSPFISQLTPRGAVMNNAAAGNTDYQFLARGQNYLRDFTDSKPTESGMTSQMAKHENSSCDDVGFAPPGAISRTGAVNQLYLVPQTENSACLDEPLVERQMGSSEKLAEILYGKDGRQADEELAGPSYGVAAELSHAKTKIAIRDSPDSATTPAGINQKGHFASADAQSRSLASAEQLAKGLAMAKISNAQSPDKIESIRAAALAVAPSKVVDKKPQSAQRKDRSNYAQEKREKQKSGEGKRKGTAGGTNEGTKSRERLGITSPSKKELVAKAGRRRNDKPVKASTTGVNGSNEITKKNDKIANSINATVKRRPSLNSRRLKRAAQPPSAELRSSEKKLVLNGAQLQGAQQPLAPQQPYVVHSGVGGSAGRRIVPSPHLSKLRQSNQSMTPVKQQGNINQMNDIKLQPHAAQALGQEAGQTMLINHGDININININPQQLAGQISASDRKLSALSKEELSQLIYQNILLQQQEQANEALRQRQQPRQASVVTAQHQTPAGSSSAPNSSYQKHKNQQVDRFVLWQNLMQQYQVGNQGGAQQMQNAFAFKPVQNNTSTTQQQLLQAQLQNRLLAGLDVKGKMVSNSVGNPVVGRHGQGNMCSCCPPKQQPRVSLATVVHNQPDQLRMDDGLNYLTSPTSKVSPTHKSRSPQHESHTQFGHQQSHQQNYPQSAQQQRSGCDHCGNHIPRPTVDLAQLFDQSQFLHLVDQYGNHSQYCRCFRIAAQLQAQQQSQIEESMLAQNLLPILQQNLLAAQLGAKDLSHLSSAQQQRVQMSYLQQVVIQQQKQQQAMAQYISPKQYRKRNVAPAAATTGSAQASTAQQAAPSVTRMEQINGFIKKLNQLIQITLKATDSINPLQLTQIKKLGNEIGIKWTSYLDAKFIKSKDFVTFLKSKVYVLFNALLMKNSGLSLFSQVEMMSASTATKEKAKKREAEGKESASASKHQHAGSLGHDSDGQVITVGHTIDQKKLQQTQIGQIMSTNQHWLNQIQVYNLLKFKNSGFKFWVECPTTYGNNFIVVRGVCKRRTWLTWVDHDPYEEREPAAIAPPIVQQASETQKQSWKDKSDEKKTAGRRNKKAQDDGNSSSNDSDDGNNLGGGFSYHNRQVANTKIHPNVLFTQIKRIKIIKELMPHQIYNHIDGINQIAAKCQLHRNMKAYAQDVLNEDPWTVMPETYIVELPAEKCSAKYVFEHEEYQEFAKVFTKGSWWIIKPGEDANRGHGIKVLNDITRIRQCISHEFISGPKQYRTCIIQRYIERPFLVHRRKFDIRVFALLTYVANFERREGTMRGWFYEEGYIRTSCKEFSLAAGDNPYIHLTNDAVQKQSQDYGRFEAGNKISYSDFDKLLMRERDVSFYNKLLPQIKNRVADVFKAGGKKLIGEVRSDYNGFEWLGLDFMIDDDMNLTLIEVNTNPCLETQSCILLQRLVPQMLDQSMKIAVDPFFGASEHQYLMNHEFVATEFKYSMVYEETIKNIRSTPTWDGDYLYGPSQFYANKMQSAIEKEAADYANGGYAAMETVELGTVAAHSEDDSAGGGGGAATMGQKDSDEDDDDDDDDE